MEHLKKLFLEIKELLQLPQEQILSKANLPCIFIICSTLPISIDIEGSSAVPLTSGKWMSPWHCLKLHMQIDCKLCSVANLKCRDGTHAEFQMRLLWQLLRALLFNTEASAISQRYWNPIQPQIGSDARNYSFIKPRLCKHTGNLH